jgi:hypothetical protein
MALVFLDLETTRFFSDPDIARLPRPAQIPALAQHFGCAVMYGEAHGWRE